MLQGLLCFGTRNQHHSRQRLCSQRVSPHILLSLEYPQIPDHNDVARSMLSSFCYKVGRTYKGFRPATQKYLSDSEGASTPSEASSVGLEDDGLRLIRKESLKSKNQ